MLTLVLALAVVTQNPPPPPGVPGPPGVQVTVQPTQAQTAPAAQAPPGTPMKTMPMAQAPSKAMPTAQAPVTYAAPQAYMPVAVPINPCIRQVAWPGLSSNQCGGCGQCAQCETVVKVKHKRRFHLRLPHFGGHHKQACGAYAQAAYAQPCY